MDLPFTLPAWLPWWAALAALLPVLLFALAFLLMPFSVIGVKTRLEAIELRLDEIQMEVRRLSNRLPDMSGVRLADETPPALGRPDPVPIVRPTMPPPIRPASTGRERIEPRL